MLKNIAIILFLVENVFLLASFMITVASESGDIDTNIDYKVALPVFSVLIANIVFGCIALLAGGV